MEYKKDNGNQREKCVRDGKEVQKLRGKRYLRMMPRL